MPPSSFLEPRVLLGPGQDEGSHIPCRSEAAVAKQTFHGEDLSPNVYGQTPYASGACICVLGILLHSFYFFAHAPGLRFGKLKEAQSFVMGNLDLGKSACAQSARIKVF